MATLIPCNIDTTPMAAEMQSVSSHVQGTTAAVVTMQSAVIAAENHSANKVCSNVNRGFYTLMCSQISQKIANKHSRVEALLMKMAQQKRRLLNIKSTMERDYGRISARYLKIFTGINKELETRILQIDQPVFELVNKHMASSSNRMNSLTAWISTSQSESIADSQKILASNLKRNAQTVLEESTRFLSQIGEQRVLTSKVLIYNEEGNDDHDYLVPVLIRESVNDSSMASRLDVMTPADLETSTARAIDNSVRTSDSLKWHNGVCDPAVRDEFTRMVDMAQMAPRVKDKMRELFGSSNFEIL